jgi:hypothetical protein
MVGTLTRIKLHESAQLPFGDNCWEQLLEIFGFHIIKCIAWGIRQPTKPVSTPLLESDNGNRFEGGVIEPTVAAIWVLPNFDKAS